jgi:hypothetical protein
MIQNKCNPASEEPICAENSFTSDRQRLRMQFNFFHKRLQKSGIPHVRGIQDSQQKHGKDTTRNFQKRQDVP